MKILIYNWADIHGTEGGGVNVYVKNIINHLATMGHDIFYLSSGTKYTRDGDIKIVQDKDYNKKCRCFYIVNSPVLAPAHSMFKNLDAVFANQNLKNTFYNFCMRHNFDIIHFNNIEGLSLDILDLRTKMSNTKFIYSFHNYNTVCAQVNLWYKEYQSCEDNENYTKCVDCVIPNDLQKELEKRICTQQNNGIRVIRYLYRHYIKKFFHAAEKNKNKTIPPKIEYKKSHQLYKDFVGLCTSKINKNVDYLISVSERTKQLVCNRGIRWNNHEVKYIGVNFAANKHHISNININSSDIALGYLGYMRHDKGYFFLLYMLENISSDIAKRIHLHLAAKCSQSHEIERLENLSKRLASITYFNGYNHKNINTILQNIELGIIPSLWEDCLPQVAYEYVCHGVPILVSDMGGAREISDNELFVYKAKSICSFEERLRYFADNKEKLNTFWDKYNTPNTVEKHCCDLIKIYTNNNCNS